MVRTNPTDTLTRPNGPKTTLTYLPMNPTFPRDRYLSKSANFGMGSRVENKHYKHTQPAWLSLANKTLPKKGANGDEEPMLL